MHRKGNTILYSATLNPKASNQKYCETLEVALGSSCLPYAEPSNIPKVAMRLNPDGKRRQENSKESLGRSDEKEMKDAGWSWEKSR